LLYAGAPRFDRSGSVFVFGKNEAGEWAQVNLLRSFATSEDGRPASGFGAGLAISDDALLVSASRGSVYAYQAAEEEDRWESLRYINPVDERSAEGFGVGLGVYGNVAVIGSPMADHEEGLATVYERDGSGHWTFVSTLASEVAHLPSITGNQVDCEEGKADRFDCDKVDLISFISANELASNRGVKMTDIWGWEDPQTGKEYVLQARTDGVAFVDISNPSNPVYVGEMMKTATSPGSAWRDVKVYKDHAFVVADGAAAHGVQIFDLGQLRDVKPADMPVTFEQTAFYDGVHSTHNIVINEETGFAYAVGNRAGGETCGGQLHMINVQDPKNPTFAGCFSHPNAGGTHDSQCVTYHGPDSRYTGREICLNSNGSSFIIADVTEKESPKTLTHTTYPNLAYTHQGWLTEDQRYFYMNDELDELNGNVDHTRTLIWDVQDLEDPVLVNEFLLDSKASDHNLYVRGHFMYQSNYQAGLRILDISDPVNPVETARFDTVPYGEDVPGFGGSWSNYPYFKSGIIAVSSRGEGLFLLKKRDVDI
jgi:choice-of-anchor B domain-containing protein